MVTLCQLQLSQGVLLMLMFSEFPAKIVPPLFHTKPEKNTLYLVTPSSLRPVLPHGVMCNIIFPTVKPNSTISIVLKSIGNSVLVQFPLIWNYISSAYIECISSACYASSRYDSVIDNEIEMRFFIAFPFHIAVFPLIFGGFSVYNHDVIDYYSLSARSNI